MMAKTYEEINAKIAAGKVVVVTAEEMIEIVESEGAEKAAEHVDVVTTGTFSPMCSSGAYLNFGHSKPRIKVCNAWLNEVNAYAGMAAVDLFIGASKLAEHDPANMPHPGQFLYGGAHVIEDLVAGRDVRFRAVGYGTDCYPRRELETWINIKDLNECQLCNFRNGYQNYNVAVNAHGDRDIYTYLGVLKKDLGNAHYSSAGQLSPLMNDPYYRTIGIGTRIWLGGGEGYVFNAGTQHDPTVPRRENGVPKGSAGTLAVTGDLKQMSPRWIVGLSMLGYGVSLNVGLGVPIPILDAEMARFTAVRDAEITAPIVDYSHNYPYREGQPLGEVDYASLRSGSIEIKGKRVPTGSLSSYPRAREIAEDLKARIATGRFFLGQPSQLLPSADSGKNVRNLVERPIKQEAAFAGSSVRGESAGRGV